MAGNDVGQRRVHSTRMLKPSQASQRTQPSLGDSHSHARIEVIGESLSNDDAEFPWKLTAANSKAIKQYLAEELAKGKKSSSVGSNQNETEGCWGTLVNYVNTIW